jgi:hypothetical protein
VSTAGCWSEQLHENSGEIHLLIGDLGRGFDVEAAMHGKRLVNGDKASVIPLTLEYFFLS